MSHFDLDFDDEPVSNSSALVSQKIKEVNKDKYNAKTVTKGFFNVEDDLDFNNDNGNYVPHSPQKGTGKKEEEGSRRRRKK